MIVFVDEFGDPGLKLGSGSSPYFGVTTVLLDNREAVEQCERVVAELRKAMELSPHKEFHFTKDCEEIRVAFLRAITRVPFSYSVAYIDKQVLIDEEVILQDGLYMSTVSRAFGAIEEYLENSSIWFDECGDRKFVQQLRLMLRQTYGVNCCGDNRRRIGDVKSASSKSNSMIQVADMISGAINRSLSDKKDAMFLRRLIRDRELSINVFPPSARKNPPLYPPEGHAHLKATVRANGLLWQ